MHNYGFFAAVLLAASVSACASPPSTQPGDASRSETSTLDGDSADGALRDDVATDMASRDACVDMDMDGVPAPPCGMDCDDTNANRRPGLRERCDDGSDEDCDPCTVGVDGDGDGDQFPGDTCSNRVEGGAVPVCPNATVTVGGGGDASAARTVARLTISADEVRGTDCNDGASGVNPGASEACDGADNDCDGLTDEGPDGVASSLQETCYPDRDGDGFGDSTAAATRACVCPTGTSRNNTDCNDAPGTGAAINPSAREVCDASMADENCNGARNESCTCTIPNSRSCCSGRGMQSCGMTPSGAAWGVCSVSSTTEVCNGVDDNCDGTVDNGASCGAGSSCRSGACACNAGFQLCSGVCTSTACSPRADRCRSPTTFTCAGCGGPTVNACPPNVGSARWMDEASVCRWNGNINQVVSYGRTAPGNAVAGMLNVGAPNVATTPTGIRVRVTVSQVNSGACCADSGGPVARLECAGTRRDIQSSDYAAGVPFDLICPEGSNVIVTKLTGGYCNAGGGCTRNHNILVSTSVGTAPSCRY